jgi:hypothetical protein
MRPWLYGIARNEALRCIRARRREQLSEEVPEMTSAEAGRDTLAARNELADLIAEAAGGLSDRDRSVLELACRHGLDGPELAEALVTPATPTSWCPGCGRPSSSPSVRSWWPAAHSTTPGHVPSGRPRRPAPP